MYTRHRRLKFSKKNMAGGRPRRSAATTARRNQINLDSSDSDKENETQPTNNREQLKQTSTTPGPTSSVADGDMMLLNKEQALRQKQMSVERENAKIRERNEQILKARKEKELRDQKAQEKEQKAERAKKEQEAKEQAALMQQEQDEDEELTFRPISSLEQAGISKQDIQKLTAAGLTTVDSVAYTTKKELSKINGLSEIKVERILKEALKICPHGFETATSFHQRRAHMVQLSCGSTNKIGKLVVTDCFIAIFRIF